MRSALTTEILAKVPLRVLDPAEAAAAFDRVVVLDLLQQVIQRSALDCAPGRLIVRDLAVSILKKAPRLAFVRRMRALSNLLSGLLVASILKEKPMATNKAVDASIRIDSRFGYSGRRGCFT